MMRRVGWIRMLGLLCAGVCAGPGMLAQNPTGHKNASTSGTVHQQQPSQAAQRQAPAATPKTSQATAQTNSRKGAAQPSPAANTQKPPTNVYTRPAASVQPNGMETTTPARSSTAPVQTQSPGMYTYQQPPARTSTTGEYSPPGGTRNPPSRGASGGTSDGPATNGTNGSKSPPSSANPPYSDGNANGVPATGGYAPPGGSRKPPSSGSADGTSGGTSDGPVTNGIEWLEGSAVGRESTEIGGNLGWVAVERTEVAGHEAAAAVVDRYLCATASTS